MRSLKQAGLLGALVGTFRKGLHDVRGNGTAGWSMPSFIGNKTGAATCVTAPVSNYLALSPPGTARLNLTPPAESRTATTYHADTA